MGVQEMYYAIGIAGLPSDVAEKLTEASLQFPSVPGKATIMPAHGDFQPSGRTVAVTILFARTAPIMIDDKDVDVVLKLDEKEYRTKFILKDMVFNGKL